MATWGGLRTGPWTLLWVRAGQEWAEERKGEKLDSEARYWQRGCYGLTRFVLFGYERSVC